MRARRLTRRLDLPRLLAACLAASLAACAGSQPAASGDASADTANDPLESTNRVFYRVDDTLDTYALAPVARAYVYVVPTPVRGGIHNVLANLSSPVLLVDDVSQAKSRRAGDTLMRFLINSSVGVLGIFDVADGWGYKPHTTDFGITLALWGAPEGPFLFLPVLGPSSPREAAGYAIDTAVDPFNYVPHGYGLLTLNWARYGVGIVDSRSRTLDDVATIKRTALDPYATFRSLYRQHRAAVIEDARQDNRMTVPNWYSQ